jgi:hypothetical protein
MSTKKIITCENSGILEKYMGEKITLYCCRYIYCGILSEIDEFSVLLKDSASIVYETGSHESPSWDKAEKMPNDEWAVSKASIESFGVFK